MAEPKMKPKLNNSFGLVLINRLKPYRENIKVILSGILFGLSPTITALITAILIGELKINIFIWVPIAAVILAIAGYFLSRRPTETIPILINGLIPSEPGALLKSESGTTVYIVYIDEETDMKEEEIFRGYADEDGRIEEHISSENVDRLVLIRARHAGYEPQEFRMTIPRHGIVLTVKMETDGVYEGELRGKNVGDLSDHYNAALMFSEQYRVQYIQSAANIDSHPFARIPIVFWLVVYIISILAFAGDYLRFEDSFLLKWESYAHSVYFSAVTITTLGFGETYPTTDWLRIAVSSEAILGVFVVGLALNSLFYEPRR
jgi:hypothetical protein